MLYYEGTIAGSDTNNVETLWSSVGGGRHNQILAPNALFGTIPGGRELIAAAYGQTIVGVYNDTAFSRSKESDFLTQPIPTPRGDDPFFVVGNGTANDSAHRSNAFEVEQAGYTIVTNVNGSTRATPIGNPPPIPGGAPPDPSLFQAPVFGSTHADNIIYAWGDIEPRDSTSFATQNRVTVHSDFGTWTAKQIKFGVFKIQPWVSNPHTAITPPRLLTDASITVTIVDTTSEENLTGIFAFATTSPMMTGTDGKNYFIVRTYKTCTATGCEPYPFRFMYKVTGR